MNFKKNLTFIKSGFSIYAAPRWVTWNTHRNICVNVRKTTGQTDGQTDRHQTVALRFPAWRGRRSKLLIRQTFVRGRCASDQYRYLTTYSLAFNNNKQISVVTSEALKCRIFRRASLADLLNAASDFESSLATVGDELLHCWLSMNASAAWHQLSL